MHLPFYIRIYVTCIYTFGKLTSSLKKYECPNIIIPEFENKSLRKNVILICAGNLTVSSSQIGLTIRKPGIVYSKGTTSITGSTVNGILIAKGNSCALSSTVVNGAILNYGSSFTIGSNSDVVGSVVSNHSVDILDGSSSITKGNLPPFFGLNIGLDPIVVPGSYLEY